MPDNRDINLYKALSKPYEAILASELELSPESDPEVLHRFRVSMRRIRSIIRLIQSEGYIAIDHKLIKILKRVSSFSSQIRDMDVMLAYLRGYGDLSAISGIYASFERMREEDINQFVAMLRFEKIITKINKKISSLLDTLDSDKIALPLESLTSRLLDNFAAMEVEYGAVLSGSDRDMAHLHNFRKECKKLRYQGEVLDDKTVDKLVQHCKRIQTILGNLHDCNVWMIQIGSVDSENGKKELIQHLESQREKYLNEFEEYITTQFNDSVREEIKRSLRL